MKYNLATHSQVIANTTEGNIELSTDEVIQLISTTSANVTVPASGTVSGTLVLDCDLGSRVHVDEINYHFDTVAPISTVTSGVKFFCKNESFDVYISLNTYYNGAYWYTIVSGTDAPRYIRVEHTVISGAGGSVNGFQVLNDDTYVDFGEDGDKTDHNVNLSLENDLTEINTMFIYNSGPIRANAKVLIEPQDTVADDILSISNSSAGPWYGVYRDEDEIAAGTSWDTGTYDNTEEDAGLLKLSAAQTEGTYTTRVLLLDENQRLSHVMIPREYPIVLPETSFFDDFSFGGEKWTIVRDNNVNITFNNNLNIYDEHTNPDSATVETKYDVSYSQDFMLSFKFRWPYVYYGPTYYGGTLTFSDGLYLRFSPGTNHYNGNPEYDIFQWYINGTHIWDLRDYYGNDWARYNLDTWYDFKFQREFNDVRLKFWPSGDPEPDWMYTYVLAQHTDIDLTGKIVLDVENMSVTRNTSLDNVKVIKNYTATAGAKSIIATDDEDTLENIEIRSSNSKPMDRLSYIEMTGNYTAETKFTRHRWAADGSIAETSSDWGRWGRTSNYWEYWYDSIREDEYIVDKPYYTGYYGDTEIWFRIRRKSGNLTSLKISDGDYDYSCYWSTYKLTPNNVGGFWVYFYLSRNGASGGSYYLDYYNSSLSRQYRRSATAAQGTFLYDMDSVYDSSGELWYTDRDLSTVFKIDKTGSIIASYLATDEVRGLFSLPDGGCWFIQGAVLQRLNYAGEFVTAIDIPSDTASYVYSDGEDGFWLHDGYVIRHLRSDGTEYFSVEIPDLFHFTVCDSGVITKQSGGSSSVAPEASYVSKEHKRILRTWAYPRVEGGAKGTFDYNRYGVRSQVYNDLTDDHASNFPISIDGQWANHSEWQKVSLRDYNFSNEQYHQVRITLRADNSANSPEVAGIYTQRAIEIPNIYPGNYGRYYLKSDVQYLNPQDTGDYTSKIRAYWYLNAE